MDKTPRMREMKEFREIMDSLLCPWFPVAGNHDIYWRGPDRPADTPGDLDLLRIGILWVIEIS